MPRQEGRIFTRGGAIKKETTTKVKNNVEPEEKVEIIRPRVMGFHNILTKRTEQISKTEQEATSSKSNTIAKKKANKGRKETVFVDNIKNTRKNKVSKIQERYLQDDDQDSLDGIKVNKCMDTVTENLNNMDVDNIVKWEDRRAGTDT